MVSEQPVTFGADGIALEGRLALVPNAAHAVVICHPHPQYGGDMHNDVVAGLAASLQCAGIATLRFNFRGTGGSAGAYDHGVGEAVDARAAVALLCERCRVEHVALAGYSFGAMVALTAGHDDAAVHRLIAIAPPLPMFDTSFLRRCAKAKLFVLGDRDQYCPYATLETLAVEWAGTNTLCRLPGADHFLGGTQETIGRTVVEFVQRGTS